MMERRQLQKHPLDSAAILRQLSAGIDGQVLEIIEQEHERIDGTGYPRGLKIKDIHEPAQIIGLVDVYEALTHDRFYRPAMSSVDAFKQIIADKDMYSPAIIKGFIEGIGLYPNGSLVQLNTKESGQIIRQNKRLPLCPVVKVNYDQDGQKIEKSREVDLSQGTRIYIIKSL
jgi:HD-GYP domain-containing protein (c-di-GMP phosphodiesterase class II)